LSLTKSLLASGRITLSGCRSPARSASRARRSIVAAATAIIGPGHWSWIVHRSRKKGRRRPRMASALLQEADAKPWLASYSPHLVLSAPIPPQPLSHLFYYSAP